MTDEGCAFKLVGSGNAALTGVFESGSGLLVLDGAFTINATLPSGNISIAEGARAEISAPQSLGANFSGAGTLALSGGSYAGLCISHMTGFTGVLELGAGVTLTPAMEGEQFRPGQGRIRMAGATLYGGTGTGVYFDTPFEIAAGTENTVWANNANLRIGDLSGAGTLYYYTTSNRGPYLSGDNRQFTGTVTMYGTTSAPPTGFYGNNAGSPNAAWRLTQNNNTSRDGSMTYTLYDMNVNGEPICFGVLQQTGPRAYIRAGSTRQYRNGMKVEIGAVPGGESVIEGKFSASTVNLKKVGPDSWLTLGTNFSMVAGSTVNIAAGGLGFNLPEGDAVASLSNLTVTVDSSVAYRVAMTSAQYDALDKTQSYVFAKFPAGFSGGKPETSLFVDGATPASGKASRWKVRFVSVAESESEPAHVDAVLQYFAPGFIIMVK